MINLSILQTSTGLSMFIDYVFVLLQHLHKYFIEHVALFNPPTNKVAYSVHSLCTVKDVTLNYIKYVHMVNEYMA